MTSDNLTYNLTAMGHGLSTHWYAQPRTIETPRRRQFSALSVAIGHVVFFLTLAGSSPQLSIPGPRGWTSPEVPPCNGTTQQR